MAPGIRQRLFALIALLGCVSPISAPAQEKKLSIYSPQAGYSVTVTVRDSRDYVALADVLQRLGTLAVNMDGKKMKLRFTATETARPVEAEFTDGKTGAKVRGRNVELASRFIMEGARGMVPMSSLPALLARTFDVPIEFHEPGRRLLIGNPGVHYSAELRKAPARLVLSFSAPVNPSIATEPGGLRMVFTREPLVAGAGTSQALDDRAMTRLTFSETNGTAELAVTSNAPLVANFSDGGRTITIAPAPLPLAAAEIPKLPEVPQPVPAGPQIPKFVVIIDPGHGGSESGAALGDTPEKDFNLGLARRLRTELENRSIQAVLLREGDTAMSLEQRALSANIAHAAVYIAIHATSAGTGVRVYRSDVAPGDRRAFLPVERVQGAYLENTSLVASSVVAELAKRQVDAAALTAPVRPLNSVAAAAIALEIAPPENDTQGIASQAYQQSICNAIGAALASLRTRLEAR